MVAFYVKFWPNFVHVSRLWQSLSGLVPRKAAAVAAILFSWEPLCTLQAAQLLNENMYLSYLEMYLSYLDMYLSKSEIVFVQIAKCIY